MMQAMLKNIFVGVLSEVIDHPYNQLEVFGTLCLVLIDCLSPSCFILFWSFVLFYYLGHVAFLPILAASLCLFLCNR